MKLSFDLFGLIIIARLVHKDSLIFYWANLNILGFDLISLYNTNNLKAGALKLLGIKLCSYMNKKVYILGRK